MKKHIYHLRLNGINEEFFIESQNYSDLHHPLKSREHTGRLKTAPTKVVDEFKKAQKFTKNEEIQS